MIPSNLTNIDCVVGCPENKFGGAIISTANVSDIRFPWNQYFGTRNKKTKHIFLNG